MLRTCLLAAVVVGALVHAGAARAQSRLTDASVTWSYTNVPRPRSTPRHRQEVGGAITLGVGAIWSVVGAALWVGSATCRPRPDAWLDCLFSDFGVAMGEVFTGVGGLAMLIGALLWASSTSASTAPAPVALVSGPGDFGAAVRVAL